MPKWKHQYESDMKDEILINIKLLCQSDTQLDVYLTGRRDARR